VILAWLSVAALLAAGIGVLEGLRRRHVMQWLPGYWGAARHREPAAVTPIHVMFCFVDHFEPGWKRPGEDREAARVDAWCDRYPRLVAPFVDADGCFPKHTFFYPEEEYREQHLDKLAALCAAGFGEVEVHLHHDNDTSNGLREKLLRFAQVLHDRHGLLSVDPRTQRPTWAFIHGNWSLDNSRPDGRWCGVNDELKVLAECGCYADFTFPSAPSDTQPATVNSIYYATDDPDRPKSHDRGIPSRVGQGAAGDLLIVQGALGWDWSSRKLGFLPRIENSDVRAGQSPSPARVDRWIRLAPTVRGRPEWKFVKIHTHGAPETQHDVLLGPPCAEMYAYLERRYNDGTRYVLHYVSARELYNIVKAAEAGLSGNPAQYRDHLLPRPSFSGRRL
jgi:hypothetical protein